MRSFADFLKKKKESDEQMDYYRNCLAQNDLQMRDLQKTVNGILSPNYSVHNPSPFSSKLAQYEKERKKSSFIDDNDCEEYFLHSGVAYSPKGKVLVKHVSPSKMSQASHDFSSDSSSHYSSPQKGRQNRPQQNALTPSTEINLGEEEEEEAENSNEYNNNEINQGEYDGLPYQYQYGPSSEVLEEEEEQNSEESLSFLYQGKTMKRYESKDSLFVAAGSMENLYDRSLMSSASQRTTGASSILGLNKYSNENENEQEIQNDNQHENSNQYENEQELENEDEYEQHIQDDQNAAAQAQTFDKYRVPHVFSEDDNIIVPQPQPQKRQSLLEEEDEEEEQVEKHEEEHRFTQFSSSFEEEEIVEPNTSNTINNLSKQQDKQVQVDLLNIPLKSTNKKQIKDYLEDVVKDDPNPQRRQNEEEEKPSSDISRSDDNEEEQAPENARDDAYYAVDEEEIQGED